MVGKLFAVLAGRFLVLVKQVFRVFKSDPFVSILSTFDDLHASEW